MHVPVVMGLYFVSAINLLFSAINIYTILVPLIYVLLVPLIYVLLVPLMYVILLPLNHSLTAFCTFL